MNSSWKERARLFIPPILPRAVRKVRGMWNKDQPAMPSLEVRELRELFPGIEAVTVGLALSQLPREPGMLPLTELVVLAALCKYLQPKRALEIGTHKGSSALAMAMHTPPEAEIFTLDLPSWDATTMYPVDNGEITGKPFSIGDLYRGTAYEKKIRQLYGDSAGFDFEALRNAIDLVFIDGSHTYENVKIDTQNAWEVLRRGGVIIWDDYHPEWGPGVMRVLHEITDRPVYHIAGTRLAASRAQV